MNRFNKVNKNLVLVLLASSLAACGGGGGSSDELEDDIPEFIPPLTVDDLYPVTSDNYLQAASSVYSSTVGVALSTITAKLLKLTFIETSNQLSPVTSDCRTSGTKTVDILRLPFADRELHIGDYYDESFTLCNDTGRYAIQGDETLTVVGLNGDYGSSNNYVLRVNNNQNYFHTGDELESNNGSFRQNLRITLSQQDEGDLRLYGVNATRLHAGVAPPVEENPFSTVIAEDIAFPEVNSQFLETPAARFDTFAFEQIRDRRSEVELTSFDWIFNVQNLENEEGSLITRTLIPLALETRTRIDEEGFEEEFFYAVSGFFTMTFFTGEYISVFVNTGATDVFSSPNITVSFDANNDSTFEAETEMTWEEFERAFFGF